jgi:hypothetical protein
MGHKIYAPNVHLFAFHSGNSSIKHSPSSTNFDEELLWKKCNDIFALFKVNQNLRVRKVSDGARVALLEGATENTILLPLEGLLPHEQEKHRVTGCACPLKIEDSYALALNLRIPEFNEQGQKTDNVELTVFQDFNQEQCFLPKEINSSLGQTVILTAWLSQKQQPNQRLWREIADECVRNFLGNDSEYYPPLYQSGQLLGSPIFEYGNPSQPQSCGQIWVWLFVREVFNGRVDSKIDNNFGFFYQKLIDLLCYRQKIIIAYQQALDVYADLTQLNQKVKDIINKIAELPQDNVLSQVQPQTQYLSDAERSSLKDKLRILPKLALDYAEGIQAIEGYSQTIEVNIKKYAEKIKQIQERIPNYDLSFLFIFTQKTGSSFQDDLKIKLSECVQKSGLVEKAIASIRGLVEIDNAQRDRTLEETLRINGIEAQKREKNLQIWFALVVTCLAITSISSQVSYPVRTVLNYLQPEQSSVSAGFFRFFLYNFYDVFLQTLVGVGVALLLGLIVWLIPKQSNLTKKSKD